MKKSDFVLVIDWYFVRLSILVKPQAPDKAPAASGSSFNQLLGIKGAAQETVSLITTICLSKGHF